MSEISVNASAISAGVEVKKYLYRRRVAGWFSSKISKFWRKFLVTIPPLRKLFLQNFLQEKKFPPISNGGNFGGKFFLEEILEEKFLGG